jgi:hypothetical protein
VLRRKQAPANRGCSDLSGGYHQGFGAKRRLAGSAADHAASLFEMMAVSRYQSVDMLRGCVHDAVAFRDHVGAGLL